MFSFLNRAWTSLYTRATILLLDHRLNSLSLDLADTREQIGNAQIALWDCDPGERADMNARFLDLLEREEMITQKRLRIHARLTELRGWGS